jgi:hypothetical protein
MTKQIDLLRILLNREDLIIQRVKTIGEAMSLDFAEESMAELAIDLGAQSGWITTRNEGGRIAIEPKHRAPVPILAATKLFHVSDAPSRRSINLTGLEPRCGGNTSLNRSYPERVHLAIRMRDAFQFAHRQIAALPNVKSGVATSGWRPKDFGHLDLYEVTPIAGADYFNDDHFDGQGVWRATAIPASNVRLIEDADWRPLYRQMYLEDFDENYWKVFRTDGDKGDGLPSGEPGFLVDDDRC